MTRTFIPTDWRGLGRAALGFALSGTGTVLITTGRVLIICGAQLHALSARFDPQ